MKEGFQVISPDFRYLYVNDTVCKQGRKTRDELLGRTMNECFPGIDKAPFYDVLRRVMTDRVAREMENEFVHAGGDREWFELRMQPSPEGVTILSLDVTARKRLESTLRQVQKMNAVGQLASGVAHDFNNMLTVITSFATLALDGAPADAPMREDIAEVLSAADRAAKLTRQLLTFSRQEPLRQTAVDVNTLVSGLRPMLERLLGPGVRMHVSLAPKVSDVLGDTNALEQALVNLAVNARDAMPNGGDLTFETNDVHLSEAVSASHGSVLAAGDYALVCVSDTGTGMPREVQERIFEPFFTTKTEGKGTGLGLATSYAIVRQAGGYIWVYSEPGRGTTFKIYLPHAGEREAVQAPQPMADRPAGGHETVLVVEDEPQIRSLARRVLDAAGYRTLFAGSVEEAEAIAVAFEGPIHLFLVDIVLPGVPGPQIAARLALRPVVSRVLYMSGFSEGSIARRALLQPGSRLLEKPFGPQALLRAVRESLS